MATVNDKIKRSLRLLGVLAQGETPTSEESVEALEALNDMLEDWSNQNLMIYRRVREAFDLVAGTKSYNVGPSQTWDTTRPQRYDRITVEKNTGSTSQFELPVKILEHTEYADHSIKETDSTIPLVCWPQKGDTFDTLTFWPVPQEANKIVLYTYKELTSFSAITDTVDLPPGYSKAIVYNLAVHLAPEYGKGVTAEIAQGARESVANLKRINKDVRVLRSDDVSGGRGMTWDWRTGGYR